MQTTAERWQRVSCRQLPLFWPCRKSTRFCSSFDAQCKL